MTSTSQDRIYGANSSLALKAPCKLATTANITLSGTQSIDGATASAGDRILVKDQTDDTENGIYIADTGTWERAPDFDGANDVVTGTMVKVSNGTVNGRYLYVTNTANPITPGTTSITFVRVLGDTSAFALTLMDDATAADARATLGIGSSNSPTFDAVTITSGPLTMSAGDSLIRGGVSKQIQVCGGASALASLGAFMKVESVGIGGAAQLRGGDASTGQITLQTNHASANIVLQNWNGASFVDSLTAKDTAVTVSVPLDLTGGQITFPATAVPSSNANTFDDYEEGDCTPGITFDTVGNLSVVLSTAVGKYVKLARVVVASLTAITSTFTHTTASGNVQLTGLPFTVENISGLRSNGCGEWQGITKTNYTDINARPVVATTYCAMVASGSGQTIDPVDFNDMPTGGSVILAQTVSYRAAS